MNSLNDDESMTVAEKLSCLPFGLQWQVWALAKRLPEWLTYKSCYGSSLEHALSCLREIEQGIDFSEIVSFEEDGYWHSLNY